MLTNGTAAKFVVSVMGSVLAGLGTYYGTTKWEPIVAMGLTAISVYLVPNKNQP